MTRARITAFAIAAAALAGTAYAADKAWNWGTVQDEFSNDASFAQSKAVCRKLGAPVIPAADRLSPAQAAALKDCDAEALYYGQGTARDIVKARQCAILSAQGANDDDNFFSGKAILMQIYANGLGVPKNLTLATQLACSIESAPAENDGRVMHLQSLMTKPESKPFDLCDDITSGYAGGQCTARDSIATAASRDKAIAAVAARFPATSKPAFADLRKAMDAFAKAHGEGEIDLSGTLRGAFVIEAEDREADQFLQDLTRLADNKWPKGDHAGAAAQDTRLNSDYKSAMSACTAAKTNMSTVKADDVRAAQRVWLTYRDAWVHFAATAAPSVPADAVTERITRLRALQLEKLPCS